MNRIVKNIALTAVLTGSMLSAPKFAKAQNLCKYQHQIKAPTELLEVKPIKSGQSFDNLCRILGLGVLFSGAVSFGIGVTKKVKNFISNQKEQKNTDTQAPKDLSGEDILKESFKSLAEEYIEKNNVKQGKSTDVLENVLDVKETDGNGNKISGEKMAFIKIHKALLNELKTYRETGKKHEDIFEYLADFLNDTYLDKPAEKENFADRDMLYNLMYWAICVGACNTCKDYGLLLKILIYHSSKLIFDEKQMSSFSNEFLDVFDAIRGKQTAYDIINSLLVSSDYKDYLSHSDDEIYAMCYDAVVDNLKGGEKDVLKKNINSQNDAEKPNSKETTESEPAVKKKKNEYRKITFKDVGGQDDAIKEIKRKILYKIKYPKTFNNCSMEHGFILYGPPGTGKSLIAEALAHEANAEYFKFNPSEKEDKYVGETEGNWRKLIDEAIQKQPSMIFIDEFDSVGKARNSEDQHGIKVLNQILTLMSDIEKNNYQIYLIAATNLPESLDKAITRPGRFGTKIYIKPPTKAEDVEKILDIHLSYNVTAKDIDKSKAVDILLKKQSTGSDIAKVVEDAFTNALERTEAYDHMDNDTYNEEAELPNIRIETEDLIKAANEHETDYQKEKPIGFNKI